MKKNGLFHAKSALSASLAVLLTASALALPVSADYTAIENFSLSHTYPADSFADVPSGAWYYDNVKTVYELGLMNGKSTDTFDPTGNITRAEALAIAARIHSTYYGKSIDDYCTTELSQTTWYGKYVEYIKENSLPAAALIDYKYDTTSDAAELSEYYNHKLYRCELIDILSGILPDEAMPEINTVTDDILPDVKLGPSPEYQINDYNAVFDGENIYDFYRAGILSGMNYIGTFYGFNNVSRAETAAVITRMIIPELRKHIEFDGEKYYRNAYAELLSSVLEHNPDKKLKFGVADLNHDGIPELLYNTETYSQLGECEWNLIVYENGEAHRTNVINMNTDIILYSSDSGAVTSFSATSAFNSPTHTLRMLTYSMQENNALVGMKEFELHYLVETAGQTSPGKATLEIYLRTTENGETSPAGKEAFDNALAEYPLPDRQLVLYELTSANIAKLFDDAAYENTESDLTKGFFDIYKETFAGIYENWTIPYPPFM